MRGKGRAKKTIHYLVKWKGYHSKENSWEPYANVKNSPELLRKFHAKNPKKPKPPGFGKLVANAISAPPVSLEVKRLSPAATLPTRGTDKAAGLDLYATGNVTIKANNYGLVATDISIKFPDGMYARIAPRSGLALKKGINVGAGVIDQDYTGPIGVILFNHGTEDFVIAPGDRIAQLILEANFILPVKEVFEIKDSTRGNQGFGSTGK